MAEGATESKKYIPGSDDESIDIFKFPFTEEEQTIDFIKNHGRIMFIVRGLPGTGKDSLTQMIAQFHSSAVVCSADHYFRDTFTSASRNPKSLRESHLYCHKRVKSACMKNAHPIIVKNTHVRKSEFDQYLAYAEEYSYTVIMSVSMNKFLITPENLARSNTKGLSAEYFEKRMRQWQEVPASVTGWFLGPEDSRCLLRQLQIAMDYLLGDGLFCRVMSAYSVDIILQRFKASKLLYCIAAYTEGLNGADEMASYYFSPEVQDNYGRCFSIRILGFLVSKVDALAVVQLDEAMTKLSFDTESDLEYSPEQLTAIEASHRTKGSRRPTVRLSQDFDTHSACTLETEDEENVKDVDVGNCSFIYLAETGRWSNTVPSQVMRKYMNLLGRGADIDGIMAQHKFEELEDGYKFCRLQSNTWFIKPPNSMSVDTVFTGIYS